MGVDRSLSLLVKFAGIDKLTGKMRSIGGASKKAAADISETRRAIDRLQQSQAKVAGFRDLESRMRKDAAAIEEVRDRIHRLTVAKRAADASGETGGRKIARSLAAAEKSEKLLITRHEQHGRELQDLSRKLEAAGIHVADLARHEDRLGLELFETNKRLQQQRKELERTGKAQARIDKISAAGGKMQSTGATMMVAGAAIGAPLVASTGIWRENQSRLTDIGLTAGRTREQMAATSGELFGMSRQVNQFTGQLQDGLQTLVGQGMEFGQAMAALPSIGKTATAEKASVEDLSNTVFAATSNLKLFAGAERDAAEQQRRTAKSLDIMTLAGKRGGVELKDMSKHFPSLTARAQSLGQSGLGAVADLAAALQIARRGAGDADEAATNVTNLLAKINAKDTITNFDKFGVDLPKALKKAYADGKTPLEAIAELTKTALKGDLSKLPFLFGDMQAQSGVIALIQNMEDYRKIRAEAAAAGPIVDQDFLDRMQDSAERAKNFSIIMEATANRIGSIVGPKIDWLKDKVSGLAGAFLDWSQRNPALANGLVSLVSVAALALTIFGGLALAIGTIAAPIMRGIGLLMKLGPVFRFLFSPIRLVAQLLLWTVGAIAAFVGLPAWIVGAIAIGLAAGAMLIWKNWDSIKKAFWQGLDFLKGLWNNFWSIGAYIVQGIISGVSSMFGALKDKILSLGSSAVGWFKGVLGIKSPSRVFMSLGGYVTEGLALGVDRGASEPLARMRRLAGQLSTALAIGAAGTSPAAAAPGGGGSGRPAIVQYLTVTIKVEQGPGQNGADLARQISEEIQAAAAAAARSAYVDDDD